MFNNILFNSIFKNLIEISAISGGGDGGGSIEASNTNDLCNGGDTEGGTSGGSGNSKFITPSQCKNNETNEISRLTSRYSNGSGNDPDETYLRIFMAKTTGIDSRL